MLDYLKSEIGDISCHEGVYYKEVQYKDGLRDRVRCEDQAEAEKLFLEQEYLKRRPVEEWKSLGRLLRRLPGIIFVMAMGVFLIWILMSGIRYLWDHPLF